MTAADPGTGTPPWVDRSRWVLGTVGMVGIATGAVLLVRGAPSVRELASAAAWLLVPAVVSDLVIMPIAAGVAALVTRRLPEPWRAPVVIGLVLSTFVVLVGWPFIGGFGRHPDNPSLLDRDYPGGALVLLGVLWLLCLVGGLVAAGRARSRRNAGAHALRPSDVG